MALIELDRPVQAAPSPEPSGPAAPQGMRAVAFDGCAGFWHAAAGDVAVVLCPPVGREWRCAYLPLRLFAERLARAGYPTLRFDYLGEGESLDALAADDDAIVRWRRSAAAAVEFARGLGARQVVLAGLRLGGAVAALAAQDDPAVDGLLLLAPTVSGRGWVRELKLTASLATAAFRDFDDPGLISDDLRLSPATLEAAKALDLSRLTVAPPQALLAAHAPAAAALKPALEALGAQVEAGDFPGLDALLEESHSNLPPHAVFERAIDWLHRVFPTRPKPLATPPPRLLAGDGWRERPVLFGPGLAGVVCEPRVATTAARRDEAVVFLSTGADPRAGLGRFAVTASRELAQAGLTSLRFDFAGVGDSPATEGDRSHPFETPRTADVAAAAALMAAEGFPKVVLVGICAGAFHALRGAASEPRVSGLFAISMLKFVWSPADSLSPNRRDDAGATRSYLEGAARLDTWLRLLRGEVRVGRIARSLGSRFLGTLRAPTNPEGARVRRMAADFSARGGRGRFLLGIHDAALDEMERWFGRGGRRLTSLPGMSARVAPRLDHGLSYAASRDIALAELKVFLDVDGAES